jgi:hypothetical protein
MLRLIREMRFSARTKYPFGTRPIVTINGNYHKLADFSENGIKIITGSGSSIDVGTKLSGVIHFHTSGKLRFEGEVVRTIGDLVAIKLRNEIPTGHHQAERSVIDQMIQKVS